MEIHMKAKIGTVWNLIGDLGKVTSEIDKEGVIRPVRSGWGAWFRILESLRCGKNGAMFRMYEEAIYKLVW